MAPETWGALPLLPSGVWVSADYGYLPTVCPGSPYTVARVTLSGPDEQPCFLRPFPSH